MCVHGCECNTCLKKYTCTDCSYMDFKKSINCYKDGVQGCKHYQYYYDATQDSKNKLMTNCVHTALDIEVIK